MAFNFNALSKALIYSLQIGQEFIEAKSAQSAGGEKITPGEMVGISAKTSAVWVRSDGAECEIKQEELLAQFEQAGWTITGKEVNENG
jgi:hypothetical protein